MSKLTYYIDGPGEVLITTTDFSAADPDPNKIICTSTCKSASISASATMEDVTGGRGLFPKRRFQTARNATLEFQDCQMDFRYASLVQGEDIKKGVRTVTAFGDGYRFVVPEELSVTLPETPDEGSLTVIWRDTGAAAAPATTAAEGTPALADDTLTFAEADEGREFEVVFTYQSSAETLNIPSKATSLPKTVKAIHKQPTFDADNNVTGHQFIEFFKLQPSAEFTEDYQERAAYAPTMTFELIDPQRPDGLIMDRTWVPVEETEGDDT